jgi:branched-chain amino acid aminotransferase
MTTPAALVAIDGKIVDREAATISVFDRGFLYGDSVFETMRTYAGVLFRLDDHMARLEGSLRVVGITSPIDVATLGREVAELTTIARGRLTPPGAAVPEITSRVMVTRGEGPLGLLPPDGAALSKGRRVLFMGPCAMPPAVAYEEGIHIVTYPTFRPSDAARGAKVGNYLESILAVRYAKERGGEEALIVDSAGFVIEGTTSNYFIVKGGRLITPPTSSSLLPGITRRTVLEIAAQQSMPFEERSLKPEELYAADELFITSTVREVLPVGRIDDHVLGRNRPITTALRTAFAERVAGL